VSKLIGRGYKAQTSTTVSKQTFDLDEMYDENYSLQQIYHVFNQLDKNWKTLDQKDAQLLEDIYDYLEQNYYKCHVCGVYFEDHAFINENDTRHECYSCFTESDIY